MRFAWIIFSVLLILAACESSTKFEPDEIGVEIEEDLTNGTETPDQADTVDNPTSAREDLKGFCESQPDVKVTYDVSGTFDGQEIANTQNIVVRGEDFKQEVQTDSLYVIDSKVYMCQNQDGWRCFHTPQEEENLPEPDCEVPDDVSVERLDSRNIKDTEAKCYELSSPEFEGSDVYCFSEEGVLMYTKRSTGSDVLERTATEYSFEVSGSDLELPAEPETIQNAQPR